MGLAGRFALQIAGFGAYAIQNKRLPDLTLLQGGHVIEGQNFPGTELRSYQPICRYGRVLVGKASIQDPGELPSQNITRANGATVNVKHGSTACFPGFGPKPPVEDVIYALLLTCRDRNDPERYTHVAIAVLEPDFSGFIFYESLDTFIAGYGDAGEENSGNTGAVAAGPLPGLALKKGVVPFQGTEKQGDTGRGATGSDKKLP